MHFINNKKDAKKKLFYLQKYKRGEIYLHGESHIHIWYSMVISTILSVKIKTKLQIY